MRMPLRNDPMITRCRSPYNRPATVAPSEFDERSASQPPHMKSLKVLVACRTHDNAQAARSKNRGETAQVPTTTADSAQRVGTR